MEKLTCVPQEAAEILNKHGFSIGYDKLTQGLRLDASRPRADRVFPFGEAFKMQSESWAYIIYLKDLYDFIRQHGGEGTKAS